MGLFGNGGLFGGIPKATPGMGFDEAFAPFQQQQPKPKFGEPGGWGEALQGIGALLQDSPSAYNNFLAIQQSRADAKRQEQQRQQQAQAENEQWYAREQWKRDNPEPPSDSFLRAMEAAGLQPGSPEYAAMARKRAEMLTNPVTLIRDEFGQVTPVRPQEMVNQPPAISEDDWNAGQPMGGGAGNGTGGFRP